MVPRYRERSKRLVAMAFSTVAWLGLIWFYALIPLFSDEPYLRSAPDPMSISIIILLGIAGAGFVAAMPSEFDDVRERRIWLLALYGTVPLALLVALLLLINPLSSWLS